MTLRAAIDQYLAWKKSRGEGCRDVRSVLRRYARSVGEAVGSGEATHAQASAFLADSPSGTRRAVKYSTLRGFYRYAIRHQLAAGSPLPARSPRMPAAAPPYIYSRDEIRRLLDAIPSQTKPASRMAPLTFRALLLLLYATGLRRNEALGLKLSDTDLENALLTVRQTKFGKTRMVPLGADLVRVLKEYVRRRSHPDAPHLFTSRDGARLRPDTVTHSFGRLRRAAGIRRDDGAYFQPRLHDLRHTFAVQRLISSYRQGADAQRLLPRLSTYLGHSSVAATQVYLTLTPDLLEEAARRFESFQATAAEDDDD